MASVGAVIYARLPTTPFWLQPFPLSFARGLPEARWWGLGLSFAGVSVLTLAWLVLGLGVARDGVGVPHVRRAALWWSFPMLLAPPLFSDDGWSYAAYGYLTGQGRSPYVVTPAVLHGPIVDVVCACWRSTPAPYGPLPLLWGGAVGRFTADPWALLLDYRLLALVGLGLLLHAVPRLARRSDQSAPAATWLAASPFAIAHGVGGVHLDLLLVGLVCAAWTLARPGRWLAAAAVVGLATAVKAPAAVATLGVVLLTLPAGAGTAQRLRLGASAGAVALGTTVGLGAVGGLGVGWLGTMRGTLVLHTPLSLTFDLGRVLSAITREDAAPPVDLVGLGLVALAGTVALWRAPTGQDGRALVTAGSVMFLTVALSPVTNYWYFLWCLPLLACCRLPPVVVSGVVALTVYLGLIAPLNPSLHVPRGGYIALVAAVLSVLPARLVGAHPAGRGPTSYERTAG